MSWYVAACKRVQPRAGAVFHLQLESADDAQTVDGRRREHADKRLLDSRATLPQFPPRWPRRSGPACLRFSNSSRMTKIVPALGLAVRLMGERPARSIVAITPGTPRAMALTRSTTASVRSSEAASGSNVIMAR